MPGRWPSLPALIPPLVLAVAAIAVRSALVAPAWNQPLHDPDGYLILARSLARGDGFVIHDRPTAYRPPLYPMLLAAGLSLGADSERVLVFGLHLALGGATAALTFATARRWGLSNPRAWIAGAIVAFDPILASQARSVMTETLATFLTASALRLLADAEKKPAWTLASGIALGACAGALLLASSDAAPWRIRIRRASLLGLGGLAILGPWGVRNRIEVGAWVWTTTHGGYTLALANNPEYYADVLHGPPGAVWSGPNQEAFFERVRQETQGMTESEADGYLAAQGWRMLRERPGDFLEASAARLSRFWAPMPSAAVYGSALRWACGFWFLPLGVAAIWGAWRRPAWRVPWIFGIFAAAVLTAVHTIYWTDLRMRAPLTPVIALLAASAGDQRPGGRLGRERARRIKSVDPNRAWFRLRLRALRLFRKNPEPR